VVGPHATVASGLRGTGSYVDPSLHWYRSTLAHNAPIVDGRSQPRVHGDLLAYEDDDRKGWLSAQAELAHGLIVQRTIVALADYVVDELQWEGVEEHEVALPMHGVDVSRVYRWTYPKNRGGTGGLVPAKHQARLLQLAREAGRQIEPSDFFPSDSGPRRCA